MDKPHAPNDPAPDQVPDAASSTKPVTVRDRRRVREGADPEPTRGPEPETTEASPEEQLQKAREETAVYLDDLKRLKAEFENYRKRILKEQTALAERGSA
ncbi:MAG: hypothetical protein ACREJP_05530, partial [Candidatus Methylomirabilales bacterium]